MSVELDAIESNLKMTRYNIHCCADNFKKLSDDVFSLLSAEDKSLVREAYQALEDYALIQMQPAITARIAALENFESYCKCYYNNSLLNELSEKIENLKKLRQEYANQGADIKSLVQSHGVEI